MIFRRCPSESKPPVLIIRGLCQRESAVGHVNVVEKTQVPLWSHPVFDGIYAFIGVLRV